MRPRNLDEYIGQEHILGHGRLLRRAIEADQLSSVLFHGPPGTGKTTLARVIAGSTRARFEALNAVLAGVKDIRVAVKDAKARREDLGQRTILFVDEVHRFNKAQQDALLPWVESGTVVLIGATTENPYFEVNKALVSRSRVFQLQPLQDEDLHAILNGALTDRERGYGLKNVRLHDDAAAHLVGVANGDARAALNALELAVETTPPDTDGVVQLDLAVAEESIQRRAVLYDREGDAHFDTISAFIKSVRGSDPDAALYWLARMVYAGEDPRFIFRRLLILASEDIGLADPHAITVVLSCAQTFDRVGMPEGRYPLAQATLYLAATNKSNSTMAFFDALASVAKERADDVPVHLKDGTRDKEGFGHGEGYLYPHAYRDHWVAQQYLPESLRGRVFWQPSDQGWEGEVGPQIARQRESQLEAMVNSDGLAPVERWTAGPDDPRLDRWVQRTAGRFGARLSVLRDALYKGVLVQRHHVVLDLAAGAGLLTWEAVRRTPEGGVWSVVARPDEARALQALAERLPELTRPRVCVVPHLSDLVAGLAESGVPVPRFDGVVGRDVLVRCAAPEGPVAAIHAVLSPDGWGALIEGLARHTPRLSDAVGAARLGPALHKRWAEAEAAVYSDDRDPLTRHTESSLVTMLQHGGFSVESALVEAAHTVPVTDAVVDRWFADRTGSYAHRLGHWLSDDELLAVRTAVAGALAGQVLPWKTVSVRLGLSR